MFGAGAGAGGSAGYRSDFLFTIMDCRFEMSIGNPGSDAQGAVGCVRVKIHVCQWDVYSVLAVHEVLGGSFKIRRWG